LALVFRRSSGVLWPDQVRVKRLSALCEGKRPIRLVAEWRQVIERQLEVVNGTSELFLQLTADGNRERGVSEEPGGRGIYR
jgi:hypothetical protein